MAQTMVNFRMDEDLKRRMDATCKEMGMSMTTAFTIFATTVVRERCIPFEISADPFYSESNMAHLTRAASEVDAGLPVLHQHELIEDEEADGHPDGLPAPHK